MEKDLGGAISVEAAAKKVARILSLVPNDERASVISWARHMVQSNRDKTPPPIIGDSENDIHP